MIGDYNKINFVNGQTPAINSVNLNKMDNKVKELDEFANSSLNLPIIIIGTTTNGWTSKDCDYLCDGTADNVEINAAINALPASGGSILVLSGTYYIADVINLNKPNIAFRGQGDSTIFVRMHNSSATYYGVIYISINCPHCAIEDIKIDGNKGVYTSINNSGIYIRGGQNRIENVIIQNIGRDGILLYDETLVKNCIIETCTQRGIVILKDNALIENNTIKQCKHGIEVFTNNKYNKIHKNKCDNNLNHGIFINAGSENNEIIANTCNYNTNNGIFAEGDKNTIAMNQCKGNGDAGIKVSNDQNNPTSGYNVITGNRCDGNQLGLWIENCSNNVISGNLGLNSTSDSGMLLFYVSKSSVTGNTCIDNYICGIDIEICTKNTITGNTCMRGSGTSGDYSSTQHTIRLDNVNNTYNLISSNIIMGKNVTTVGGSGNTLINNKYS